LNVSVTGPAWGGSGINTPAAGSRPDITVAEAHPGATSDTQKRRAHASGATFCNAAGGGGTGLAAGRRVACAPKTVVAANTSANVTIGACSHSSAIHRGGRHPCHADPPRLPSLSISRNSIRVRAYRGTRDHGTRHRTRVLFFHSAHRHAQMRGFSITTATPSGEIFSPMVPRSAA